jgi:hypothetical protein
MRTAADVATRNKKACYYPGEGYLTGNTLPVDVDGLYVGDSCDPAAYAKTDKDAKDNATSI